LPNLSNIYSRDYVGGYFLPKNLGMSLFLSKNSENKLDTRGFGDVTIYDTPLNRVYKDSVNIYESDFGLTNTIQYSPIVVDEENASWMKASVTEYAKAGSIINAKYYQEFVPYQSKYETLKYNNNGIRRQGDEYDPWYGDLDNTWENELDWPSNWRNQHPIESWYEQSGLYGKQLYQWKTDIFGNQYGLYKNIKGMSMYDKALEFGEIWLRDARNRILPATSILKDVYDKFYSLTPISDCVEYNIKNCLKDIDIWYDTIMVNTSGYLLFNKLHFDYDDNRIYSIADGVNYVCMVDGNTTFGDVWFDEQDKTVTVSTMVSSSYGHFYPVLYVLDISNNEFRKVYDAEDNSFLQSTNVLQLTSIETPVFTFNKKTRMYNVSYVGRSSLKDGMYLGSLNISNYGLDYELVSAVFVEPVYTPKCEKY